MIATSSMRFDFRLALSGPRQEGWPRNRMDSSEKLKKKKMANHLILHHSTGIEKMVSEPIIDTCLIQNSS